MSLSDICFSIDKFDVFVNENSDAYPAQYIIFGRKDIIELPENSDFKFVSSNNIQSKHKYLTLNLLMK